MNERTKERTNEKKINELVTVTPTDPLTDQPTHY